MPFEINSDDQATTLALVDRCSFDDVSETVESLNVALESNGALKFDFSRNESVDTATVQFLVSAARSCQTFLSSDDEAFEKALSRWGINLGQSR